MDESRFDEMLCVLAQQSGGIHGLLDNLFGFFRRRTDFFVEAIPGEKVGFLPGVAEQIVFDTFDKHKSWYDREHPENVGRKQPGHHLQEQITVDNTEEKVEEIKEDKPPIQLPKQQDSAEEIFSTLNGDTTERYKWSQDMTDVTIQIKVPQGTKSRDLNITISSDKIHCALKADPDNPFISGTLHDKVKSDDSYWSIEDGCKVVITLDKARDNIWKCVVEGDPEIDTKKVDNVRNISDYDEETQAGIQKVMYDQERKLKGLPTSEEEKQQEILKQAWNAEGSPFAGQPFDPSVLKPPENFPPPGGFPPPQ